MGDYKEEIKTSKNRIIAADDQAVESDKERTCGSCGSKHIRCIYRKGDGSIIGYYLDEEIVCLDCGTYTLYSIDYDS